MTNLLWLIYVLEMMVETGYRWGQYDYAGQMDHFYTDHATKLSSKIWFVMLSNIGITSKI